MNDVRFRHVYVHVPFCARRCAYCDFAIAVRRTVPVDAFVDAIDAELRLRGVANLTADTLYLGGGTPTRLGADGVARLLDTIRSRVALSPGAEVTLEANPEDFSPESVRAWREAGVNRLSIGVQSFDDRVLQWMHRVHDADAATRAVTLARDGGLAAYSVDLIFAVPEALERDWSRDLELAMGLHPDHVSLYGLTIEQGTPLGRWHGRGDVLESTEERYESEFMLAHERLGASGFEHYEVSNFALPGRRARHNSAYWLGVPYLGLGPSAHGFDGSARRFNVQAYAAWSDAVNEGHDPLGGIEVLTEENRIAESVYLGLRTTDGLPIDDDEVDGVRAWIEAGWVSVDGGASERRLRCSAEGWLRLDSLAATLTARRSRS